MSAFTVALLLPDSLTLFNEQQPSIPTCETHVLNTAVSCKKHRCTVKSLKMCLFYLHLFKARHTLSSLLCCTALRRATSFATHLYANAHIFEQPKHLLLHCNLRVFEVYYAYSSTDIKDCISYLLCPLVQRQRESVRDRERDCMPVGS